MRRRPYVVVCAVVGMAVIVGVSLWIGSRWRPEQTSGVPSQPEPRPYPAPLPVDSVKQSLLEGVPFEIEQVKLTGKTLWVQLFQQQYYSDAMMAWTLRAAVRSELKFDEIRIKVRESRSIVSGDPQRALLAGKTDYEPTGRERVGRWNRDEISAAADWKDSAMVLEMPVNVGHINYPSNPHKRVGPLPRSLFAPESPGTAPLDVVSDGVYVPLIENDWPF